MTDELLTWSKPHLPDCAYGYYANGVRMYCKLQRAFIGDSSAWLFYRSDSKNQGYLRPQVMGGVETKEQALAAAGGYFLLNGEDFIDVHKAKQEYK